MRVGFVGAGRMGTPMVRRLVDAGHQVNVLGRTAEKRFAIAELGAQPVAGVAEVAAGADAVVVCVFTDQQVRDVCLHDGLLAAMAPGSTLVLHTTGSPNTARDLAAKANGVGVVDAPVSGGPHDIAAGRVTLFVGGDDGAVARVKPVLDAYADPILHAGACGAGQLVKLVNNTLFAAQIGLVAEATRLGAQFGIDEGALLDALTHGSSQSRVLSMMASAGSAQGFIAAVGEFIGKDVAVVRRTVAELGGQLGILDAAVDAGTLRIT
ncbi:NAD(P)-dependent oxidoreductase [Mycolicibacterium hodleri]|uniref:NAD(P)-dependent oxidoreductase n=1 Tax=Mycolicibacterium hodleri TaxID=49897 RepID=A0A502E9J6_9MYCO|nr:NAD(P)-dependent oxidoreductase [Mycolicibacterium hodleri]TPG33111.1 NAD(P)-dependent oxidoreductase [Mycolicibacterium hodleri]